MEWSPKIHANIWSYFLLAISVKSSILNSPPICFHLGRTQNWKLPVLLVLTKYGSQAWFIANAFTCNVSDVADQVSYNIIELIDPIFETVWTQYKIMSVQLRSSSTLLYAHINRLVEKQRMPVLIQRGIMWVRSLQCYVNLYSATTLSFRELTHSFQIHMRKK